jgi:uncharacterized protein YbaP (TraB family)
LPFNRLRRAAFAGLAALLTPAALCAQAVSQQATQTVREGRPALWRVADADTTIFLFGTVHALPKDARWLTGNIAGALLTSDTLVTEVVAKGLTDPAFIQRYAAASALPEGQTLRSLLTDDQRTRYEAALETSGFKPEQFDRFKPWFVANTLVVAPLLKKGYAASSGSEQAIDALISKDTRRIGLETGDEQIAMFNSLPQEVQVAALMDVVGQIGKVEDTVDRTVDAWLKGDVVTVGKESESKDDDPRLAEALLYPRNERWAEWIEKRLATPGRVFMAVGAGHLAGPHSVQKALEAKGLTVTRLQ